MVEAHIGAMELSLILEQWRLTLEPMESHSGDWAYLGAMETYPGAVKAHPGAMETYPRALLWGPRGSP
jgi:hypothetical protein